MEVTNDVLDKYVGDSADVKDDNNRNKTNGDKKIPVKGRTGVGVSFL